MLFVKGETIVKLEDKYRATMDRGSRITALIAATMKFLS